MHERITATLTLLAVLALPATALAGLEPSPFITVDRIQNARSYVLVSDDVHEQLGRVRVYCRGDVECVVRTPRGSLTDVEAEFVDDGHHADLEVVGYSPWGNDYVGLIVDDIPWF